MLTLIDVNMYILSIHAMHVHMYIQCMYVIMYVHTYIQGIQRTECSLDLMSEL